jgi:hypothetical protein
VLEKLVDRVHRSVDPRLAGPPWTRGCSACGHSGGRELVAQVLGGSGDYGEPHWLRGLAAGRSSGPGDEAKLWRQSELIITGLGARRRGDGVGDGYDGVWRDQGSLL